MKLGIISDIHADFDGLSEALKRLEKIHRVDEIICAGDLIGYGKQSQEVIAFFRQNSIPTVRGNHDSPSRDTSEIDANYLRNLPLEWQAKLDDKQIYLCHGIPQFNFIGFTEELLEKAEIQTMLRALRFDILIAGHTHEIFCQKFEQSWILNAGSVYSKSREGSSHSYGILDLSTMNFSVYDLLLPVSTAPIFTQKLD